MALKAAGGNCFFYYKSNAVGLKINKHITGHGDSMTESAQWANSVKI